MKNEVHLCAEWVCNTTDIPPSHHRKKADVKLTPVQRGIATTEGNAKGAHKEIKYSCAGSRSGVYFIRRGGGGVFYQLAGGESGSNSRYKQALCMRLSPQTFIHPSTPFDFLPSFLAKGTGNSLCGSKQGVHSSD